MGLETPQKGTPGKVVRETPGQRPAMAGMMIVGLTLIELFLFGLVLNAVWNGWNSPVHVDAAVEGKLLAGILKSDQQIISAWIAGIFYCLTAIIFLYQRYFMDHVTVQKYRFRKWEDEGVQLR